MVLDRLFSLLSEEIRGLAPPLEGLIWGEETMRLPMTSHIIWDVYEKGEPGPLPSLESVMPPPPPEGFVSLRQQTKMQQYTQKKIHF